MNNKNYTKLYIIMVYVVFFILFCIVGIVNIFITQNEIVLQILKTLLSWTAFFVFWAMFKKLLPGKTLKEFIKGLFLEKLNFKLFFGILLIQSGLFFLAVKAVALFKDQPMMSLLDFSLPALLYGFFIQLIGGPFGEEPAYRGYLLLQTTKKHGMIKGSLVVGILWGMWHFPLWLITGYKGIYLLIYCVSFLLCITSASVIMGIVYLKNRNIINVILIHQMINFTMDVIYTGDLLTLLVPISILYFIAAAVICVIVHNKKAR